ncbi:MULTISPECIES: TetR/AcrR family transcriptional regulator [unclassified Streptomyces]|uniref:TetR/AcrR family transcriptional regulator n=1 Tax=unclassified Streptomyces TaxID=2593676 RepID=UPI00093C8E78|nr:TetR/AcrR family transcriptional regulator [Streptomyces sp. TSRI0107]OKJ88089.1 TetR family transcriptional regulator [Streptomyces sp. TSRI0107]
MSPKQQRGAATAEVLLDTALRVYAEAGEQGLTVSAVTRASGVSLGSLYHHFGSIDGLLDALTRRWLDELLGELLGALQQTRTARTGIRALTRTYLTFVQKHPAASRLLHSSRADRRTITQAKELRDTQEARVSAFGLWIQTHVDSGEVAPLPQALMESLVLGPIVATARRRLSGLDDADLEEAMRVLPDRIWRSIAAEAPAVEPRAIETSDPKP